MRWLGILVGGGTGALLRYVVAGAVQRLWAPALAGGAQAAAVFPLGTLLVNLSGCFAIGLLGTLYGGALVAREELRLPIFVGLLGGYTTFSSYGWETLALLQDERWALAAANLLLSNALGLLAVWCGMRLGQLAPLG